MIKTGIYKIRNIVTNKIYIGSSTNIGKRWRDHKWHLKEGIHHNSHLQSSYNKYGLKNFIFSIEIECGVNDLLYEEKKTVLKYKSKDRNFGYNKNDPKTIFTGRKSKEILNEESSLRMKGDKNPMFGKTGKEHPKHEYILSDEKRKKMSEWAKNRKGSNSNASKLTEKEVLEIREDYEKKKHNQQKLSEMYCVSQNMISLIINRKYWTHI